MIQSPSPLDQFLKAAGNLENQNLDVSISYGVNRRRGDIIHDGLDQTTLQDNLDEQPDLLTYLLVKFRTPKEAEAFDKFMWGTSNNDYRTAGAYQRGETTVVISAVCIAEGNSYFNAVLKDKTPEIYVGSTPCSDLGDAVAALCTMPKGTRVSIL